MAKRTVGSRTVGARKLRFLDRRIVEIERPVSQGGPSGGDREDERQSEAQEAEPGSQVSEMNHRADTWLLGRVPSTGGRRRK